MIQLILISLWALSCLCCFLVGVGVYIYRIRHTYTSRFEIGFVCLILIGSAIPIMNVLCILSLFDEYITKFIKSWKKDKE